jgi:transposase
MESSSVWYGLYRYMTDTLKMDVILSNPYQTKAIAASKKKTDRVDARILADLHRGGYIAECYVADADIVESRQLTRYRHTLVESRARYKNLIHGILLQNGTKIPGTPFAKGYVDSLRRLGDYRIDGYLAEIESHDRQIAAADVRVWRKVKESEDAVLLTSIPGVGRYTALTISAEIGDVSRFADSHRPFPYAGIVPSVRSSADVIHHGRITKRGSTMLRWILAEAVHTHVRYAPDSDVSAFYRRIAKRRGTAKATIAAASKMLRFIYWMLSERRKFVNTYSQDRKRVVLCEGKPRKLTA